MQIKTAYDLKTALNQIIAAIDEKNQFFENVSDDDKCAIEHFRKSLEKRRNEMKAAISDHYQALEREVYPLLDKVAALRSKLAPIDTGALARAIPQVWQLREAVQLVETMERLSNIPQESWDKLGQLAQIANQTKTNQ